jgi:Flp pilus assembly pilin Flp
MSTEREQAMTFSGSIDPTLTTKRNQRGASLVEYALLVALIAMVAIVAVRTLGRSVSGQFSFTNATISG